MRKMTDAAPSAVATPAAASSASGRLARRTVIASIAALPFGAPALAQAYTVARQPDAPESALSPLDTEITTGAELRAWIDAYGRPTAKVTLGALGPFDFLVDTGANSTVISESLALQAGAIYTSSGVVNGTTGSASVPLAIVQDLSCGVVRRRDMRVAVLPDSAFATESGILGADVFVGRRLTFDIPAKVVKVEPSRRTFSLAGIGNLRMRNGMLAELPGRVGKVKARLMLDTGAQQCIANPALDRELARLHPYARRIPRVEITGVTGHVLVGEFIELPTTELGELELSGAVAVAADAPIFHVWGLDDEPAMIVGVDVLSRLQGFSIDYGTRRFEGRPMALMAGDRLPALG